MEPIVVKITGDTTGLQTAAQGASGSLGGLQGAVTKLGPAMLTGVGAAVAVGAALTELTLAAAEDRAEQEKLELAITNAGAATGDWKATVDEAIKSGADLAYTDTEIRDALTPLIQSTGDVDEATKLLAVAQDVARAEGVDLAAAADAVALASEGETGKLEKMMPALKGAEEGTDLVAAAAGLAAGQADLFGKSAAGQSAAAKIAFTELGEKVGEALLPILDALLPALLPFVELLGELISAVIPVLKPLITALANAFGLVSSALKVVIKTIKDVMDTIGSLIDKITGALGELQKLVDFDLPSFDFDIPDINPFSTGAQGRGGGAMTVYINTGADPNAVGRALRRYQEWNG